MEGQITLRAQDRYTIDNAPRAGMGGIWGAAALSREAFCSEGLNDVRVKSTMYKGEGVHVRPIIQAVETYNMSSFWTTLYWPLYLYTTDATFLPW